MTVDEFLKYVCDQYRDIFKNNYDEGRAKASAERLLAINGDNPDKAKVAADAIISYTRAKVEAGKETKVAESFDDKSQLLPPRWMFKYGDHLVDIIGDDRIILDGKEFHHRTELLKPFEEVLRGIQHAVEEELIKRRRDGLAKAPERLAKVKEMVKDAPKEVLHSFNEVVNYFDSQISLEDLADKLKDHKKITIGDAEYDLVNAFVEQGSEIVVVYGKDGRQNLTEAAAKELLDKGSTPDGKFKIQIKK